MRCKASPGSVDGDQLLNGLSLDEGTSVFRAVSDNLMDGVEDGDHSVLLQVFGWPLLATWQVAHQVPHGITSCMVEVFFFTVKQIKRFYLICHQIKSKYWLIISSILLKIESNRKIV